MKILNVYFKNINSLAGESRIDFDKSPIADASVFAITGPNGSGKTSILDAITLALYGETFRFDKPAENVMTRHTAGCFAQVEFLVSGEKYRSIWQVKRQNETADGAVMAPQMQLTRLDEAEQVIASEAHKVLSQNTDLIGMDFRRFTRSIMLAQGDFSAFLNALDAERLDILERIISVSPNIGDTESGIYADYKQQLAQKIQTAEQQLAQLTTKLAESPLLTDIQQETAELDLADQQLSFAEFKQEKTALLQQQANLKDLQQLEQQIERQERKQNKDQQQLVKVQNDLEIIQQSGEAFTFEADLQKAAETKTALTKHTAQQKTCQQEFHKIKAKLLAQKADESYLASLAIQDSNKQQQKINELQTKLAHVKTEMQSESALINAFEVQLPEKQQSLSVIDTWLSSHKDDHGLIENMPELGRLKNLRSQSVEIQKNLKGYQKAHKNSSSAFTKNQKHLSVSTKGIAEDTTALKKLQAELAFIADGHTLEEVIDLHDEQRVRVADFVELLSLAKVHKQLVKRGLSKRYEHLDKAQLDAQSAAKNKQIDDAQNILDTLEKSLYREQLTIKLTEDRHKLEDNYACSLCGSLEHPYAKNLPTLNDSQKALKDQSLIVRAFQSEAKKINIQVENYAKFADKNIKHTESINRIQAEWLSLCSRLNAVKSNLDITSYRAMRNLIKQAKKENNDINVLIQRYRGKNKDIAKLEVGLTKKQATLDKLQAKHEAFNESGQGQPQEMQELEAELASNMQTESSLSQSISAQLTELGENLPSAGREDKLYDVLSKRRQDFQTYSLRQNTLKTELEQLNEKVSSSSQLLQEHGQQQQQIDNLISEQQLSQLYFSQLEKQQQLIEIEQQNTQLSAKSKQINTRLEQQLQQSSYDSLNKVQAAIDLAQHKDQISALQASLQQQLEAYPTQVAQLEKQLAAERIHTADDTLEGVVIQLREKKVQMDIVSQELASLEKTLAGQQQLRTSNAKLLLGIEQQQVIVQQLSSEQQKIAQEPELAFRRRVQERVANRLLKSTNRFLDKINGRYHISSTPSEMGLALEVVDNKQGESRRSLKSLSGGESFVLSLALALGLSEIANNGRAVDSLFIDEGFGNLDAETLYTVVSTLESLKAQGKTVGIISHIEGIKQSIKTQIELVKQPNGMSKILVQEEPVAEAL
ncbi:MAG: AAA family ATPase [Methyloprofundus sp.]|nr:AAA family ATPase [Methyloprofundus sp.]